MFSNEVLNAAYAISDERYLFLMSEDLENFVRNTVLIRHKDE